MACIKSFIDYLKVLPDNTISQDINIILLLKIDIIKLFFN